MSKLHKHRILPGHMGGLYEPDNVELLTISEHAEAHRLLFENFGCREDWLAWQLLSGVLSVKDRWAEIEVLRRQKLSSSLKGNTCALGAVRSVETRAKMSASKMGHSVSPETRRKISLAGIGRPGSNKGKKFSIETRQKLRTAKLGKPWTEARRQAHNARVAIRLS